VEKRSDVILTGDAFVAIERGDDWADAADEALGELGVVRSQIVTESQPKHFYLAIHKGQLNQRYFLSAYLRQLFPGAVMGGAARSVDTKVVTFREQNGKLFLIDADSRKVTSDLFDPTILIDAFPLVEGYEPFENAAGSEDYVLIDPAAGLNQFTMVGELFGSGFGVRLDTELSFVQGFHALKEGIGYEQVFTAYFNEPDNQVLAIDENPFRVAGTLGMALRKYTESAEYVPTPMPAVPHYFVGGIRNVPNTGTTTTVAMKWAIHEGMQPIEWRISRDVMKLQNDPRFADYDIAGAIKNGIESWNQVFGFQALNATVAQPGEDMSNDDVNMLIVDLDPTAGFAFADWRHNPETGEVRGASVYLSATFLTGAHETLLDDEVPEEPANPAARLKNAEKWLAKPDKSAPSLAWGQLPARPLCEMHVSDLMRGIAMPGGNGATMLTKKEKVERTLTEVVAHEIGHTLGLRHNFKGSLLPPTSSVMEYQVSDNSIAHPGPGEYDIAAIKYLYGMSDALPDQPFCTDGDVRLDATCAVFDRGADPLTEDWVPFFDTVWSLLLDFGMDLPFFQDMATNGLLAFVRTGATEADSFKAWELAIAKGRVPVAPEVLTENTFYGAFADKLARTVLARLYLDPPELRGAIVADPPADEGLLADVFGQIRGNLVNQDGIRSFETRLTMVKILKKMQTVEALSVLLEARAEIAAGVTGLTGVDALLANDLLAHIDQAASPYFN
jgi:hypothetical protein